MLLQGSDPTNCWTSQSGLSLLMLAVLDGDVDACQLLINADCDVNYQNSFGFTALMYAVRDGFVDIVNLLLERGADPSLCGKSGYSPLICAAQNGYSSIVEILSSYSSVDACDDEGQTPLMCACANGHLDTVCLLLRLGADPFRVDMKQRTSITHCIDNRSFAILSIFLQKGICPRYEFEGYWISSLYVSALQRYYCLIRLFLLHFCCVDDLIQSLVHYPNIMVEEIILEELDRMRVMLTVESFTRLSDYFNSYILDFVHLLMFSYKDQNSRSYPLCGVVETCVWCVHCVKIMNGCLDMTSFSFYLDYVESRITEAAIAKEESVSSNNYNGDSPIGKTCEPRHIKLLFSMIEIYCVMCGSVIHNLMSREEQSAFRLNDRSHKFLQKNYVFLKSVNVIFFIHRCITASYSDLYNHMVFFACSFNKLKSCSCL